MAAASLGGDAPFCINESPSLNHFLRRRSSSATQLGLPVIQILTERSFAVPRKATLHFPLLVAKYQSLAVVRLLNLDRFLDILNLE